LIRINAIRINLRSLILAALRHNYTKYRK